VKLLNELAGHHRGRIAVVIGGAPSRLTEIAQCPEDAVFLSANDHGCKQRRCDYIASLENFEALFRPYGVPIISRRPWADFVVQEKRLPNSAALGAWAAWVMGCAPIIIIGVECYQGGTYADDSTAKSAGRDRPLAWHLEIWSRLKTVAPGGDFCTVGGPLLTIFPRWPAMSNESGLKLLRLETQA
jgi:hypothetical protein